MNEENEVLLSCPYCRTRAGKDSPDGVEIRIRTVTVNGIPVRAYQVCCPTCRARGPLTVTEESAGLYWNRRR